MSRQRGIPFEQWPTADRNAFSRAISGGSRRTKEWSTARLSPSTIVSLRFGYGGCLGWLEDNGHFDPSASPANRWPAGVVEAMVDDMSSRYAVATTVSRVRHLKKVLTMLDPSADLAHLDQVLRQLGRIGPAQSPIVHQVAMKDLLRCADELMRYAEENEVLPLVERAFAFQTALQIALLALRPWRSRAFCAMQLGVHLVPVGGGWRMVSDRNESNWKRSANSEFPSVLLQVLQRFLSYWRPILCEGASVARLWVRPGGMNFGAQHLHYQVTKATEEHFNFPIPPKWFRKILATTIGRDHPEVVHIVGTVLGHADHAMSEQIYNLAQSVTAYCELASCIDGIVRARDRQTSRGGTRVRSVRRRQT